MLDFPEVVARAGEVVGEQVVEQKRTYFGEVGLAGAEVEDKKDCENFHDC